MHAGEITSSQSRKDEETCQCKKESFCLIIV